MDPSFIFHVKRIVIQIGNLTFIFLVDVVHIKFMFFVHLRFTFHSYVLHRVALPQSIPFYFVIVVAASPFCLAYKYTE